MGLRLLAVLLLGSVASAQDVALDPHPTRWRLTLEHFEVDTAENLGLLGIHWDLLDPIPQVPELYLGLGGYAAVSGLRGGLFVGGLTAGYQRRVLGAWSLDAGYFAGGGGGGGAGSNDGLMLRPHLAVERAFDSFALRAEVAHVEFPDGRIDDTHVAFGVTLPSEILLARERGAARPIPGEAVKESELRVRPTFTHLDPQPGSMKRTGGPLVRQIQLLGIGVDYFLTRGLYLTVEASGAIGGRVDGFATGMAGLGLALPLWGERLAFEARALAGAGGGGDVATGGGFGWTATAGLASRVWRGLAAHAGAGTMRYPDGDFDADVLTAGLSWSSSVTELARSYPRSRLAREGLRDAGLGTTRFQVVNKTYMPASDARKKNGRDYDTPLHLVGVGIEHPLTAGVSATGRAFGAWSGDVGGYAEGLFGLRWETSVLDDPRHNVSLAAEAGAAGGGGADVGSGLLFAGSAGYRYALSRRLSLLVEVGQTYSHRGTFEAQQVVVGLAWDLRRALLR